MSQHDDLPAPRRVSVDEARDMTGMITVVDRGEVRYLPRDQGREIVPWQPAAPPAEADVGEAWRPLPSVQEVGKPHDRALATVIRSGPLLALTLIASTGAVILLLTGYTLTGWLLLIPSAAGTAAYLAIVLLDLEHNSPSSVERHRINQAAKLKGQQLRQDHELRRAIVEAWLRRMDREG